MANTPSVTAETPLATSITLNRAQSFDAIKTLLAGDNEDNTNNNSLVFSSFKNASSQSKSKNSINAVSDLLKSLLNQDSMEAIKNQTKSTNSLTSVAGLGTKVNSKFLPSYNTRTPIVEISINGYHIYPAKRILGTATEVNAKVNFQSLSLHMPQGGLETSVSAVLTLFTKNPEEILSYTESWATPEDEARAFHPAGADSERGSLLPAVKLKFGWAFSDSNYSTSNNKQINDIVAMSPEMTFVVLGIAMEDPGTSGTTFTFTMHESGAVILDNSSDNLIISSDYPQQQLRVLLEGVLGIRLFTLDDLLYLGAKNSGAPNSILTKSQYASIKLGRVGSAADIITDQQDYTFFTNDTCADVGINNRTFMNVAKELAAQCRCKWYPHKNSEKAADDKETTDATKALYALVKDLETIKALPSGLLSVDIAKGLQKSTAQESNFINSNSLITKEEAQAETEKLIRSNLTRLSTRCNLVWINNVPPEWNTTGSAFFLNSKTTNNPSEIPEPYKVGAFFLLPELLDDYDVFLGDMPVIYGPGASAMPYFYGSGQNVLQASLGNKQPKMFGEVLSLSTNHNNLLTQLAGSVDESSLAYAEEGKRLTGLQQVEGFQSDGKAVSKNKKTIIANPDINKTKEQIKAEQVKLQALVNAKVSKFKRGIRGAFKGSLALGSGNLLLGDSTALVSGANKSGTNSDSSMAKTASLRIRTRVATFLKWPTQTKISILGDPNLLRLGPGCFELFSYYPVEDENGKITQEMNTLTSGLYYVNGIDHTIDSNGFITTLEGKKVPTDTSVTSITNKLFGALQNDATLAKEQAFLSSAFAAGQGVDPIDVSKQLSETLRKQFVGVDLSSSEFTSGLLASELRNALSVFTALSLPKK